MTPMAAFVIGNVTHSRDPSAENGERRFVLHHVPWKTYVALRDELDDRCAAVRMTYLKGTLELMSPSSLHEETKKIIARLIETWAEEKDVDLRGFGSTTYRREATARGLEPDECYTLGPRESDESAPDIAIEVVVQNPLLDKMDVYAGLGVPEVWVWSDATRVMVVNELVRGAYETRPSSDLVPGLDLRLLSGFVKPGESHTALAKGFRARLREA
jgi:Uma2 family endonuclease